MKYLALANGTIGKGAAVRRVRAGEVFILPAGHKPGKWMQLVGDAVVEPKAKKAPKAATTMSELAQIDAKALAPKGADDLV